MCGRLVKIAFIELEVDPWTCKSFPQSNFLDRLIYLKWKTLEYIKLGVSESNGAHYDALGGDYL